MYRTAQKYCKKIPPDVAKVLTRSLEDLVLIYLEAAVVFKYNLRLRTDFCISLGWSQFALFGLF